MLLALLVAPPAEGLVVMLLLLEMLLLVHQLALGDGMALEQLALGYAADAQILAMTQALLIQLEIWAHYLYLVQLRPSCQQQLGPFASSRRPDATAAADAAPGHSQHRVLVCR